MVRLRSLVKSYSRCNKNCFRMSRESVVGKRKIRERFITEGDQFSRWRVKNMISFDAIRDSLTMSTVSNVGNPVGLDYFYESPNLREVGGFETKRTETRETNEEQRAGLSSRRVNLVGRWIGLSEKRNYLFTRLREAVSWDKKSVATLVATILG